ncbi:MAG TPA: type II/IV secretion system protein, partial [Thermogutta sp.]|nr:type II/IV secretion system protein [Thermogutta sp.]
MSTTDLRKTNVRRRLGDILVEKGYLRPEQLQAALEQQRSSGRTRLLGEILLSLGYCSEEQIAECLAEEYGLPFTRLEMRLFDQKIVDILPREYIENNSVLPLFRVRDVLTVAVAEPSNLFLFQEIEHLTGLRVRPIV